MVVKYHEHCTISGITILSTTITEQKLALSPPPSNHHLPIKNPRIKVKDHMADDQRL